MNSTLDNSVWHIHPSTTWPPNGALHPPISPSVFEVLRACRLRAVFQRSHHYPQRSRPRARLGTAFHRCRELMGVVLTTADSTRSARAAAVALFNSEVAKQRDYAQNSPRDALLPWPGDLQQDMGISLAILAGQLFGTHTSAVPHADDSPAESSRSAEEGTLTSSDGLITGRPDLVEQTPAGPVIVEYKTGSLEDQATVSRFERQCLIYAWLWHACTGVWPIEYHLINDVLHQEHRRPVDEVAANSLVQEARGVISTLSANPTLALDPSVGPTCDHCDYRPWCEPFWQHGASPFFVASISDNRERLSIQGEVTDLQYSGAASLIICLRAPGAELAADVPLDSFQHLRTVSPGKHLRVLDAFPLTSDRSWLKLDAWSEVFIVE